MKIIELGIYGIEISHHSDAHGCAITSQMKEPDSLENEAFNAAVDGLESIILGHFAAGVDVTTTAYLEGIETAYDAIGTHFS
ncbi:hypothetical protein MW344_003742 [Vibrio parahaemolyticus]|uniref:Uncharacterized protein n=1 Tax=Vibrio parahaemolyticus TaxID=670 RepID=A0A9Q3UHN5_VIBPH|nr:hypothetical protein [Vibrio parahaemolyticus]EGQ8101911.1 hypothetical protein [Vibrio parahaemolyticus]EGQ8548766.1 hypothetical protein [Vibrio parahaemolyticus]EGQ9073798.1 hypothetical protein [Vibrio parahaemolyticus]EGQ9129687.1 hypothetical protein [Vibrio parahaemolyticus]EHA6961261.1 hypothetical protein [Vibrio parahaemolyticus]